MNKRKYELSILNVIFCLLVIFIHTVSHLISTVDINTDIYNIAFLPWRLSSFVVQGFVMLSGIKLFLRKNDDFNYLQFLKSRLKHIIIPYIMWFIIYYVFFMATLSYPLDLKNIALNFFAGSLVYHLYFVVIIVQFYLLMPLWRFVVYRFSWKLIIPCSILITLLLEHVNFLFPAVNYIYYDRTFTTYLMYWIIGCYIGKEYDSFKEFTKQNFKVITTVFCFSLLANASLSLLGFKGLQYTPKLGVVHAIYSVCVVIFLFSLAVKLLSKNNMNCSIISKIDSSSYQIYLSHCLVIYIIDALLSLIGITNVYILFILRFIFTYLITISLNIFLKNLTKKQWRN